MALVNCPECGRNNISNTAEQCPECGYAVKKHFEKKKEEELLKSKKQQALIEVEEEYKIKLKEIECLSPPSKPTINSKKLIIYISLTAISLLFIITTEAVVIFLTAFILIFISLFGILITISNHLSKKDEYKKNVQNWEKYKKTQKEKLKTEYLDYINNIDSHINLPVSNYDSTSLVRCPYCNSGNTRKISTSSKAASVALFGIFSFGKVSKQWHCNDCKSDF